MPHVEANGVTLHYELDGPAGAPVVVFSNSLGTTARMWDAVVPALAAGYRCLRYDTRGHGRSAVIDRPATIDDLAADLAGLLDALSVERAHVVGLSLGGMTAQAFAAAHPHRVASLTLMATAAFMPGGWDERAALVRAKGMEAIADAVTDRWFTPGFGTSQPEALAAIRRELGAIDPAGYAVCCGIIRDMDLRPRITTIGAPTLILAGAEDPATPVPMMQEIQAAIAGSELVILPRAAHLLAVERAEAVVSHLAAFLARHQPATADSRWQRGLATRRAVLGDAHVDRALAAATGFGRAWQGFITRTAWCDIWSDPTLPLKTRSLVTLALTAALGREEEFALHVRPALQNGVSEAELEALLMQVAVYAGVPAANAALRRAAEILAAAPIRSESPP